MQIAILLQACRNDIAPENHTKGGTTMAQCPQCSHTIRDVLIEPVFADYRNIAQQWQQWRGVTYSCRYCQSVLSIGSEPVAVQDDTRLKRRTKK